MQRMNKMFVSVLIAVFVVVGLGSVYFTYNGVQDDVTAEKAEAASITTTLGIVGADLDTSFDVTIAKGSTAYDVLLQGAKIEGISVTTEDFNGSPFVSAISGVEGSAANYWSLYINDESSIVGLGEYIVQEGDKIEMRYIRF